MNLDIVIPLYNEQDCVDIFVKCLIQAIDEISGIRFTIHLVDDGSTDLTPVIIETLAKSEPRINVVSLWGNHGHQRALVAGLEQCTGDVILMLDGDGQHPVEIAMELIELFMANENVAVVQAVRTGDQSGYLKNHGSRFFYWMINRLVPEARIIQGSSDFRVISSDVLDILMQYSDRHRNLRVLLASLNLPTLTHPYAPNERISGKSKYKWKQMLTLGADGLFAFSSLPLRLSLLLMAGTGLVGLVHAFYGLHVYFAGDVVPGWTSIVALIAILFCGLFGVLAIMCEYISRIYEDVRRYPIYRIRPGKKCQDRRKFSQVMHEKVNEI